MSADETCNVLHKLTSSLEADTGENHASDCYRDGSPSVQRGIHAETHSGQQKALSEALQEVER